MDLVKVEAVGTQTSQGFLELGAHGRFARIECASVQRRAPRGKKQVVASIQKGASEHDF